MADESEELSPDDLEEQSGEALPDREVMSIISPDIDAMAVDTLEPHPRPSGE